VGDPSLRLKNGSAQDDKITKLLNYQITKSCFKKAIMANTATLTKEERKKSKRSARKKMKAEKPKKPRDYARGSKKRKVKKLARGQSKR
jgi:hypothetical protein